MYGEFSQESIEKVSEILDYTRCKRADGTYYGTDGQCRKGVLTGAKELPPKAKSAPAKPTPAKKTTKKAPAKPKTAKPKVASAKPAQAKPKTAKPATKKTKVAPVKPAPAKSKATARQKQTPESLKTSYDALVKKQKELVSANKAGEALKMAPQVGKAYKDWQSALKKQKPDPERERVQQERQKFLEIDRRLTERQRSARGKLSEKDLKAIQDYTDEGGNRPYTKLNRCLRSPVCVDLKTRLHASQFDKALAKLPKNEEGNAFYRGVGVTDARGEALYQRLLNAQPGTKMKDPGFSSYSLDESVARSFFSSNKTILFVSRNKSLTPISAFSKIDDEYEAVLPRGTTSTIRKVTREGDNLIVEMD